MDILKVLSRGTKRTFKGASSGSNAAVQLPSAGTKTNPQLFHDEVRGQKRKRTRTADVEPQENGAAELPEVDFFAPTEDVAPKLKAELPRTARAESPLPVPGKRLSEEECRQVLRSHRLKVTLLSKHEEMKVKKSKKKKKAAVDVKKEDKKQLSPQPLESFGELRSTYGISRRVAENLITEGYRTPTEVQLGSLPVLLRPDLALGDEDGWARGVDFLAVAPTGSGKTVGFLIPAINSIMRRRAHANIHGIHELEAVIVAPTRELAHQIANEGRKLAEGTGLKVVSMKKGMRLAAEQQSLVEDSSEEEEAEGNEDERASHSEDDDAGRKQKPTTKADILVTTPLLLLNFLTSGSATGPSILPSVHELVLDEADVLLDPLFREQTMGIWTACTNVDLRLSCWSATMGSNIESLVHEKVKARADSMGLSPRPLIRLVVGLKDTAVPNIRHKLTYTATEQGKLLALRQLLRPTANEDSGPPLRPPFLVFTQTIERATALHEELKYDIPLEAGGAARIAALHSGLPDSARSTIMRKFRAGDIWVLITTDVLARGVDFAGVNGVVNYDVPGSSAGYVHRAGRTGRAGREGGVAVTLYTKEDIPFIKTVANVIAASEKQAGRAAGDDDERGVQKWLLDALPDVTKADRKKLKERGVEARRSGSGSGAQAQITSKSGYERRREHNRLGAIEGSKRRVRADREAGDGEGDGDGGGDMEWDGFAD